MRKTGFVYSPIYLKHDTGSHPENSNRLTAIIKWIEKENLTEKLINLTPIPATVEQISLIHDKEYIHSVKEACENLIPPLPPLTSPFSPPLEGGEGEVVKGGRGELDGDTVISEGSYDAALLAAGGVITGIDAIFEGKINNAFCCVRPPGHHAERDRTMGFCILNNIAIGAKYAQKK